MKHGLGMRAFGTALAAAAVLFAAAVPLSAKGSSEKPGTASQSADVLWVWRTDAALKDKAMVEERASEYLKSQGVAVRLSILPISTADYQQKTQLMIASGERMDILFTASWLGFTGQVAKGAFKDITELFEKVAVRSRKSINPALVEGVKIDGRLYAFPVQQEVALADGFFFRRDLMKKYGVETGSMATLADVEKAFALIKQREPSVVPTYFNKDEGAAKLVRYEQVGGMGTFTGVMPVGGSDRKLVSLLEYPPFLEAARTMHRWFQAGYVNSDALTSDDFKAQMSAGKVFSKIGTMGLYSDVQLGASYGFEVVKVPLFTPLIQSQTIMSKLQAVPTSTASAETAVRVLDLANGDAAFNNLLNFGIEKVHYVRTGGNRVDWAPGLNAKNSGYAPNIPWQVANVFLNYLWPGEPDDRNARYEEWNAKADSAYSLGFVFDPEPVKTEMSACQNAWAQVNRPILSGAFDPDTAIPAAVKLLRAAGMDRIVAEKQRQFDAWTAKNK